MTKLSQGIVAGISHHALVRLVQRAGVEKYADVIAVVRAAWASIALVEMSTRDERMPGETFLVPFNMPCGSSALGAFLVTVSNEMMVATTFISGELMGAGQYGASLRFLDAVATMSPATAEDAEFKTLRPFIRAAQSA